jgi:hypothetical protein
MMAPRVVLWSRDPTLAGETSRSGRLRSWTPQRRQAVEEADIEAPLPPDLVGSRKDADIVVVDAAFAGV